MIVFHGVSMGNAAPVKIEDIRVSPIQRTAVVRKRALLAGADFVRMQEGQRTVAITFAILEQDFARREQYIEAICQWATTEQPAPMALPYRGGKLLDVICTGLPEPSTRQWWESRLTLTFTAFDPYFYEPYERSANCGNAFFVSGDAPPRMRIERVLASAAQGQAYGNGSESMTFANIPAGQLVIDLNAQTATVDGTSIMQHYAFASAFLIPRTGTQTITGTGVVKWRERWRE